MNIRNSLKRITIDDLQCGGRPWICSTRIRVTDLLELLGADAAFEEVLEDFSYLERDDVLVAMNYAPRQTGHPVLRSA